MPFTHFLLALAVVAIFGSNFVVIKTGLIELPPLLFATMRFVLSVLPWVLFIKRPAGVAWSHLATHGVLTGLMFGLLFLAVRADLSPGLASLLMQAQVFFTLILAAWLQRELIPRKQWLGLGLAFAGFALIAWVSLAQTTSDVTLLGLGLAMCAAMCWARANITLKQIGQVNMLQFMVWSSVFAVPPLVLLSLCFEGLQAFTVALPEAHLITWAAMFWQALGNALFGFGAWGWLLARHPAATVTPVALLIPFFGMGTSALVLGESLPAWKLGAAALVIAGLVANMLAAKSK